jgi:hypothetical protein
LNAEKLNGNPNWGKAVIVTPIVTEFEQVTRELKLQPD